MLITLNAPPNPIAHGGATWLRAFYSSPPGQQSTHESARRITAKMFPCRRGRYGNSRKHTAGPSRGEYVDEGISGTKDRGGTNHMKSFDRLNLQSAPILDLLPEYTRAPSFARAFRIDYPIWSDWVARESSSFIRGVQRRLRPLYGHEQYLLHACGG